MCGIVGSVGEKSLRSYLVNGLKILDYRGYDSVGVAFFEDGKISVCKSVGRVESLNNILENKKFNNIGIGHTRWATHGAPTLNNTHPHKSFNERFVIVHNGVIENFRSEKDVLLEKGYKFYSETDTEVIVNIIQQEYERTNDILSALNNTLSRVKGSLAIAMLDNQDDSKIYFAKRNSSLLIGVSSSAIYLASDPLPMIEKAEKFIDVLDNQYGYISKDEVVLMCNNIKVSPKYTKKSAELFNADLNGYPHYMLKEIEETPSCINRLLDNYYDNGKFLFDLEMISKLREYENVVFLACGTSYHACLIGKEYLEKANKKASVYIASEWAYFPNVDKNAIYIVLSQSGETADLIKCLNIINENKLTSIAITNTKGSTIERLSTYSCLLYAGLEIAVASTKAYVAQVALLYLLMAAINNSSLEVKDLLSCNKVLKDIINRKNQIKDIANKIYLSSDAYFLGRGSDYYVAKEASLKLKEITYIHSEAFPSGELKHGPIALIEKNTPVIAFISINKINQILRNNLMEVLARNASTHIISTKTNSESNDSFIIDDINENISCIALALVAQYLAYYTALLKNTDIDKPRNLAKSVTVE